MTTISFAVVLEPRKIILVTVTPSSTMQGASQAHGMREMKDRQTMKDGGGAIKHGPPWFLFVNLKRALVVSLRVSSPWKLSALNVQLAGCEFVPKRQLKERE